VQMKDIPCNEPRCLTNIKITIKNKLPTKKNHY